MLGLFAMSNRNCKLTTPVVFVLLMIINFSINTSVYAGQNMIKAKVIATMNAGGYTYAQVDDGSKKVWAAGPKTALKTGDKVSITTSMQMDNFHSDALNRTFPVIYFVNHFKMGEKRGSPHAGLHQKKNTMPVNGVNKIKGGYSIADILASKNSLKGKTLQVRGKVTKVSNKVMGENWLHIRDSSSLKDLVVTTKNSATVGDIVIVKGKLALNKDFGYGYVYPIILENSKIVK